MKLPKKIAGFALCAALGIALVACSQQPPPATTQSTETTQTAARDESQTSAPGGSQTMAHDDAARGEHDLPYDAEFLDMMVHHHQMALQMSRDALENAQSGEVKRLAQAIIDDQQKEITQMQSWRKSWYPDVAMMESEEIMHHMTPMDMSGEGSFDERFLREMIRHHQDALKMSQEAVTKAEHPELRQLAQQINDKQEREITEMEEMRRTASR